MRPMLISKINVSLLLMVCEFLAYYLDTVLPILVFQKKFMQIRVNSREKCEIL
jgi:hypothetical protein